MSDALRISYLWEQASVAIFRKFSAAVKGSLHTFSCPSQQQILEDQDDNIGVRPNLLRLVDDAKGADCSQSTRTNIINAYAVQLIG
ncbi:hypothetical protein BOCO_0039 [Bombiscardovia coagulans]|uniref:Uncharacterized protein n=1 Tax=Bombiscardovia coagulans TaxID=686666 RepID=A0A261EVH6_9BIFI|nr:hypothetical protein BOCO_0039 [Bombiscardovia coagulans]